MFEYLYMYIIFVNPYESTRMSVGALARFGVDIVDEKQSAFFKAKLNISKRD